MTRCRDRVNHNGGFLPLELVNGPNPDAWNPLLQFEYLSIVGSDDENVVGTDRPHDVFSVGPDRPRGQNFLDEQLNLTGFLGGGVLISFVHHRQISKARTVDPGLRGNRLPVEIRSGVQAALVEDLGRKGADVWMQAPRLFQEQTPVRRDRG